MKTKYPRTFHLPYSLTITEDDKRLPSDDQFKGTMVVMLEKMDGENTSVYPNGKIHARSMDGQSTPWQSWIRRNVTQWAYNLPENLRVCGENLYAKHSIEYLFDKQSQYFQVFSIWDQNLCLSWSETEEWCELLNIEHVPVIYTGIYKDKDTTLKIFNEYQKDKNSQGQEVEGFVIRNVDKFKLGDFSRNVAKYVRANHVQTDEHWTENWTVNPCKQQKGE